MRRIVIDPSVIVSSLLTRAGTTAAVLDSWRAGAFELVISPLLLAELERVLRREKFRRYSTHPDVDELLLALRRHGMLLEDPGGASGVTRDPKDDYLVALAQAAEATAIVSGDWHLLELDIKPPVLTPSELLELIQPS